MLPAGAGIVSQRIGKGGFWGAQGSSRDSAATRPRARLHRRARRERECGRARAQTARARPRGAAGEVALYGKLKQLHALGSEAGDPQFCDEIEQYLGDQVLLYY